jgi:glycosyltransferase involved in cell wall biosynthesis
MENRRLRVLFVTNIPSPYQVDFFTALHQRPELSIEVLFCAATESDRQFEIPYEFPFPGEILKSYRLPGTPKDCHIVPGITRILQSKQPFDVAILSGSYYMPAVLAARRFIQCNNIPWYYWGENPRKKYTQSWKDHLREAYLKRFLSSACGVFGIGERACKSYRELVHANQSIENLPYSPNLDPILEPSAEVLDIAKRYRNFWQLESPYVVHFSGSLTPRKAPNTLVEAFIHLAQTNPFPCLQIAGDGPMRDQLEDQIKKAELTQRVRFLGFLAGNSLQASYIASDLFVLPTRCHEGWGVVVQEALAAGLPIIATDRVGAIDDFAYAANTLIDIIPEDSPTILSQIMGVRFAHRQTQGSVIPLTKEVARNTGSNASAAKLAQWLVSKSTINSDGQTRTC